MSELFGQLGVDWKLLLSQGVNFAIVLAVLTIFVYRPLLELMNKRRERIAFGLEGAKEAERRLGEIDVLKEAKIEEAEKEAFVLVSAAETRARKRGDEIAKEAEEKAHTIIAEGKRVLEHTRQEAFETLSREAHIFIKEAIIKTVKLDPAKIDEKLIRDTLRTLKEQKVL